jgi:hypothetical protein
MVSFGVVKVSRHRPPMRVHPGARRSCARPLGRCAQGRRRDRGQAQLRPASMGPRRRGSDGGAGPASVRAAPIGWTQPRRRRMTTPAGRWSIPAESRLTFDLGGRRCEQHQSTGADSDALPSDRRPCLPRSATHLPWGHHHGRGGTRTAPAFPPKRSGWKRSRSAPPLTTSASLSPST